MTSNIFIKECVMLNIISPSSHSCSPSFRLKVTLAVPAIYLPLISCASSLLTLFGPIFLWLPSWCWQRGALTRSDCTLGRLDSMAPGFNNTGLRPVLKVKENLAAIKTFHHFCQWAGCNLPLLHIFVIFPYISQSSSIFSLFVFTIWGFFHHNQNENQNIRFIGSTVRQSVHFKHTWISQH